MCTGKSVPFSFVDCTTPSDGLVHSAPRVPRQIVPERYLCIFFMPLDRSARDEVSTLIYRRFSACSIRQKQPRPNAVKMTTGCLNSCWNSRKSGKTATSRPRKIICVCSLLRRFLSYKGFRTGARYGSGGSWRNGCCKMGKKKKKCLNTNRAEIISFNVRISGRSLSGDNYDNDSDELMTNYSVHVIIPLLHTRRHYASLPYYIIMITCKLRGDSRIVSRSPSVNDHWPAGGATQA